jgi:hypothetical protein
VTRLIEPVKPFCNCLISFVMSWARSSNFCQNFVSDITGLNSLGMLVAGSI